MSEYVLISPPKKVYWVVMPSSVDDQTRIELLQYDLLIYPARESNFAEIERGSQQFYLFNLDGIIEHRDARTVDEIFAVAVDLLARIKAFVPERSIVHTNLIDERIEELFDKAGVSFMRVNLHDPTVLCHTLPELMRNYMSHEAFGHRAFVRIVTGPYMQIKVQMRLAKQPNVKFEGQLVDVSLNGAAIYLKSAEMLNKLPLKEILTLRIQFPRHAARIHYAVVTRVDSVTQTIGLNFDHTNEKMVEKEDASALSAFIYQAIKDSLGKIENEQPVS